MAYSSPYDVRNALTPGGLTDDVETAAGLSDDQLKDAIAEADSAINAVLNGRVLVPGVSVTQGSVVVVVAPAPLRYWSRDIAAWLATLTFKRNKDVTANDPVRQRYDFAMAQLAKIASGEYALPDPPFTPVPGTGGDGITIVNLWDGDLFGGEDYRFIGSRGRYDRADFGWNRAE